MQDRWLASSSTLLMYVFLASAGVPGQAMPSWRHVDSAGYAKQAMVYDSARGRFVCFANDRTLEWDGVDWQVRSFAVQPALRYGAALTFDSWRGTSLLFGGMETSGFYPAFSADLWRYDGADWRLVPAPGGPPARAEAALAFDSVRGRVLLFGGQTNSGRFADLWEWDGANWLQVALTQPWPVPAMTPMSMLAFDSARGVAVMYVPMDRNLGDSVWEWNGAAWRAVPSTGPAWLQASLAYNPVRQRTQLFGQDGTTLWEWDGTTWSSIRPPVAPPRRHLAAMACDTAGRTLVFGGLELRNIVLGGIVQVAKTLGDTWEFANGAWWQLRADSVDVNRDNRLVYDVVRDRLVRFGFSGAAYTNSTWEWDGSAWAELAASPPAISMPAAAYALGSGRIVLFGGWRGLFVPMAETWTYDGTAWTMATPANSPPARTGHRLCSLLHGGRVLLFGGRDQGSAFADTWEWDGQDWTQLAASGPSARSEPAMAYSFSRQEVVLFGGVPFTGAPFGDTWVFAGGSWSSRPTATSPPARSKAAMADDIARDRIVLVSGAGIGSNNHLTDTWEFDGVDWLPGNQSPDLTGEEAAYHARLQRVFVFRHAALGVDFWSYTPAPAAVTRIGSGCGATSVPVLDALGWPRPGAAGFATELDRAQPSQPYLLAADLQEGNLPLPGGCVLRLGGIAALTAGTTGPTGHASVPLPVPGRAALLGISLVQQAAVLDAAAPLGLQLTNGLRLTVGD